MSGMKIIKLFIWVTILILPVGCLPFDKIYSHDFNDGFFKLKSSGKKTENIYLNITDDSLKVYSVQKENKFKLSDTSAFSGVNLKSILPGNVLCNSTLVKTSADIDLSTAILKFRPASGNVPSQLSTNVNGIFYTGFRKDFFKLKSSFSELHEMSLFIRHTGFDFGFFAGIGITPVTPTVTMNRTIQEYDGIVFQKGFSVFGTYENMSVGFAIGFDNLIGHDKSIWIYNQKPWIGLVLGIANF
jgi:hypothetical protein